MAFRFKSDSDKWAAAHALTATAREAWLANCAQALAPVFTAAGYTIPSNIRYACGFPSKAALSRKHRRIGECWSDKASAGKVFEVFVSPMLDDALTVAATLAHEIVHATVGLEASHKAPFKRCALAIGLTGKMTATVPGDAFKQWFKDAKLPPYPHQRLNASNAPKTQTTRMLKCECLACKDEGSPYIVRLSQRTLDMGAPICPVHHEDMTPV